MQTAWRRGICIIRGAINTQSDLDSIYWPDAFFAVDGDGRVSNHSLWLHGLHLVGAQPKGMSNGTDVLSHLRHTIPPQAINMVLRGTSTVLLSLSVLEKVSTGMDIDAEGRIKVMVAGVSLLSNGLFR